MSLLAPLWLLLAGAAAVPLLVHLLRRRSGSRTEFPAARYLLRAEREHSRSLRLRNLLLMLLRVAAVLMLALAAARPSARWLGTAGPGHAPTALAIVLDNSLSTSVVERGRPAFERMRDGARAAIDAASPDDRVWIVTADGRVHGGTAATARAAVGELATIGGGGDLSAAVARAAATSAQAPGLQRRVAIITDGQRSAWAARAGAAGADAVVWAADPRAPANRSVASIDVRPARWTPQGALHVRVRAADSAAFRVTLGPGGSPRTLARGVTAPGEEVVVRAVATDTGWLRGAVEIDRDELAGDDVRHFAVWAGPAPRVAVDEGAGPFARSAVEVLRSEGRIATGDAVLVVSADGIGARRTAALVVAPSDPARLGAANQALARRSIPWRFGRAVPGGTLPDSGVLRGVAVRSAFELVPTAIAPVDTLAKVGGRPWIVSGVAGGARYVLVASPLVPEATDLPVRAAFVPWLAAVLGERLAGGEGGIIHAVPGASVRRPAWADSLELSPGNARALGGSVDVPLTSGVYFLTRRGARVGALVVNAEENESVLDRWNDGELQERIAADRVAVVRNESGFLRRVFAGGGLRPLVVPLLVAALLLLVAEAAATFTRGSGAA